jgi:uncharacterized membrane protein YhaH (DUF805 family)
MPLPRDVQKFLNWYLAPWSRLGRRAFNIILFLVFLPLMVLQVYGLLDMAGNISTRAQAGRGSSYGQQQAVQEMAKSLLNGTVLTEEQAGWQAFVPYLLYALLYPVVLMRLRDMGWDTRWAWLAYAPLVLGFFDEILGLGLPFVITLPFLLGSFYVLTMLSVGASRLREEPAREATIR